MTKSIYIINSADASLAGVVGNVKNIELTNQIAVSSAKDLEVMSNAQLTGLYNKVTGEARSTFKTAKTESATKVFAALEGADQANLIKLDAKTETKVAKVAKKVKAEKVAKVRDSIIGADGQPVRNSKLQRCAAAFRETDEHGKFKPWTVKELMEKVSTPDQPMTEGMTKQYISILRNPSDRFKMKIVKDKEGKIYTFEGFLKQPSAGTAAAA